MGEAKFPHQLHGGVNVPRAVAAADGLEDMVLHGLGVHADAGDAVDLENGHFVFRDGIGPSGLHGDLLAVRQVKALLKGGEDAVHLLGGEGGGGTAAHVKGTDPEALPAHHLPACTDLCDQGVHIGRHQ